MQVMTMNFTAMWVHRQATGWKKKLPLQFMARTGVFSMQGTGQDNFAVAGKQCAYFRSA